METRRAAQVGSPNRVVAVVAATTLLSLLTGCSDSDASKRAPTRPVSSPSATAVSAGTTIPIGEPQALSAGCHESPTGFSPRLRFCLPSGWYGSGDATAFGIGQGLDTVNQRFADVAIQIETLKLGIDDAVAAFKTVPGLIPGTAAELTVAGRPAKEFRAKLAGDSVGLDKLGSGSDINEFSDVQLFVQVGTDRTLLIRTEIVKATAKPELVGVLQSLSLAS
jgi:hypothetical protein